MLSLLKIFFFFSSRRRHTRSTRDWSSDVCSSDLRPPADVDAEDDDTLDEPLVELCRELEVEPLAPEPLEVDAEPEPRGPPELAESLEPAELELWLPLLPLRAAAALAALSRWARNAASLAALSRAAFSAACSRASAWRCSSSRLCCTAAIAWTSESLADSW